MYINTHTHSQIYDANLELVNLSINSAEKTKHYSYGIHPWYIDKDNYHEELRHLKIKAHEKKLFGAW